MLPAGSKCTQMNKITLENFRCFREKQEARLAPLTLLVGENSTGKTSFMALIRALWDVAFDEKVPNFKEEPYDLGSFDEIAHHRGGRAGRANQFEAGFTVNKRVRGSRNNTFDFQVTFQQKGTAPIPVKRRFARDSRWVEIDEGKHSEMRFSLNQNEIRKWEIPVGVGTRPYGRDGHNRLSSLRLLHVLLKAEAVEDPSKSKSFPGKITEQEVDEIHSFISEVGRPYIAMLRPNASAPVRSNPRRTYDPSPLRHDPKGDYIPMYLASMYFRGGDKWMRLKSALEKFGKDAGLFDEISVRPLGKKKEAEPFQLQIKKYGGRSKGPQRNLIDVGYGVSQVLPVIMELLQKNAQNMFLMQQPEVHLHPSAQAALGSLFCELAGKHRQLVVETHSDYLLDRVRMDVRDNNSALKREDVSILYFERKDLDVKIHSLQLDEEGQVVGAPPSYRNFFMEEVNRRLKL